MKRITNKYGLMIYPAALSSKYEPYTSTYNVGDYIQSLAAKQYLPQVDELIPREGLDEYSGDPVNMIMNSWYIHNPKHFIPSLNITPFYISVHINSYVKDTLLTDSVIEYLKSKQPIGCRDLYTLGILKEKNIDAYFSGCLTTTLDIKYKSTSRNDDIIFADPIFQVPHPAKLLRSFKDAVEGVFNGEAFQLNKRNKILKSIFANEVLDKAKNLNHLLPGNHSEEQRFAEAERFLNIFAKARLVVTSRIHCALPCLALGTPVIFINYGFKRLSDQSRFAGLTDLFNTINISPDGTIASNFKLPIDGKISLSDEIKNPCKYLEFANELKTKCYNFINSTL